MQSEGRKAAGFRHVRPRSWAEPGAARGHEVGLICRLLGITTTCVLARPVDSGIRTGSGLGNQRPSMWLSMHVCRSWRTLTAAWNSEAVRLSGCPTGLLGWPQRWTLLYLLIGAQCAPLWLYDSTITGEQAITGRYLFRGVPCNKGCRRRLPLSSCLPSWLSIVLF